MNTQLRHFVIDTVAETYTLHDYAESYLYVFCIEETGKKLAMGLTLKRLAFFQILYFQSYLHATRWLWFGEEHMICGIIIYLSLWK